MQNTKTQQNAGPAGFDSPRRIKALDMAPAFIGDKERRTPNPSVGRPRPDPRPGRRRARFSLLPALALLLGSLGLLGAAPAAAETSIETTLWSATLTAYRDPVYTYYSGCSTYWPNASSRCPTRLTDDDFVYDGVTYRITGLWTNPDTLGVEFDKPLPPALQHMALYVGDTSFAFDADSIIGGPIRGSRMLWNHAGRWTDGQQVSVKLATPAKPRELRADPRSGGLALGWWGPSHNTPAGRVTNFHIDVKEAGAAAAPGTGRNPGTGWVRWVSEYRRHAGWRRASLIIKGLAPGTRYDVRVRAEYAGGVGPWARTSGTPASPPPASRPTVVDVGTGEDSNTYAALIAQMYEWREDPDWRTHKSHTDRWDRALLAFGETVSDDSLTPMTAAEAQAFADSGMPRWERVAQALKALEAVNNGAPDPQDPGQPAADRQSVPPALHGDLLGQMYGWREDPDWRTHKSHTDRWDRALLAFGEPVSDTSLTPMTDSEAQGFAGTPWGTRWVAVAQALNVVVTGTSGADTLTGTGSGELLVGLGGADTLSGQGGDDELRGGNGNDALSGGAGADRFVFFSGETDANTISDFEDSDVIVLKGSGWSSAGDIIAGVQAIGSGDYRYTLASGLTVQTTNNRQLRTEDFVTEE